MIYQRDYDKIYDLGQINYDNKMLEFKMQIIT